MFRNAQIDGEEECLYVHAHGWVHSPPDLTPQEAHAPLTPSSEKMMQMEPWKDRRIPPSRLHSPLDLLLQSQKSCSAVSTDIERDMIWKAEEDDLMLCEGVFPANSYGAGDGAERKKVQLALVISEHDAQIRGLLIDCADCTITETSNYHDMDLVMINDEWDRLYSTSAPLLLLLPFPFNRADIFYLSRAIH